MILLCILCELHLIIAFGQNKPSNNGNQGSTVLSLQNTYSWKMCVSYTKITGNVKSKHKQYDHWHSQDFSTGSQSEGAKRPSGGEVGELFEHKKKNPANQWGGGAVWALVPLIATPVTVV